MIFGKRSNPVQTPFGTGKLVSGTLYVPWKRHRGVLINLVWNEGEDPDPHTIQSLSKNLDAIVDAGLERIGAAEFPDHLGAVLPENIDFSASEGDFSLSFYCPDDEDYLLGVTFKDGKIISDWEGH